ncbi:MAG: E1 ubiquitin-activating protein uba2 [Thelocarpon superellum]|nr:MAG: E1 ubiquitin-activating protein uba2 [Thelocarpon superellum]
MPRDRYLRQSLGTLRSRIAESRVLLVGAGGIGCELLKNLVLTGFGEIQIVDLDTIDLSNLNRQFLFRHEHIKQPKALVAKAVAGKFNPRVKIDAHHANIKDAQFNVAWFQGFTLVFNALDNLDARRHVNKMCLAADVPLIESGTTGFNGQVQVIKKGKAECYDCNTKETPKTFPICTIRSTPSQPIHCIVWAKSYLFTEIFGASEDEAPELNHTEDAENMDEIENLRREAQALQQIRASMGTDIFPRRIFEKVFGEDVERLRGMEDMWRSRKAPEVLPYDVVKEEASAVDPSIAMDDQRPWTLAENFAVFSDSVHRLSRRLQDAQAQNGHGAAPAVLTFDKDDVDALDFVVASANLRSLVFGIETRSKFGIKQMAGNIIPAIATTNAMVAGLCVLQAFKVMRDNLSSARMVFLTKSTDRIISAEPLRPPKPDCPVCSVVQSTLEVDTSRATLNDLVQGVLRETLGYGAEFSVNNDVGTMYDPELEDNLSKSFSELGIQSDSFLTIVDEDESSPRVNLVLSITANTAVAVPNGHTNGVSKPTDVVAKRKRAADDDGEAPHATKRGKAADDTTNATADDLIVVDDDGVNGAIIIGDDG